MPARDDPVTAFFAKAAEIAAEIGQRGGGLTDIRQKLVEEPWFGRTAGAKYEPGMAEQLGWDTAGAKTPEGHWNALCDQLAQERAQQPEHAPEHNHDFDR